MRSETAAQGLMLYAEGSTGSPISILLRRLEARAATLRSNTEGVEEEVCRAGALHGWLRKIVRLLYLFSRDRTTEFDRAERKAKIFPQHSVDKGQISASLRLTGFPSGF